MPLFTSVWFQDNLWSRLQNRNNFRGKTKFCLFVVTNGKGLVRNEFFKKLNSVRKVDSCGSFMNNTGIFAPRDVESYLNFISQYKFMICFENAKQDYYLTE